MSLIPVEQMEYHPTAERIVNILCQGTQNDHPPFFRIMAAYYMGRSAGMMRANVLDPIQRKKIPINVMGLNLAPSGFGKTRSMNIMDDQVFKKFNNLFLEQLLPTVQEERLQKVAAHRANLNGTELDLEYKAIDEQCRAAGPYNPEYDSGTSAAMKQMHWKLSLIKIASLNFIVDEIGEKFSETAEILTPLLELYDVGKIKQKLTKETKESQRVDAIAGAVPANLMMYGTPYQLMDGGKTEEAFFKWCEIGLARRALFCLSLIQRALPDQTAEEIYDDLVDSQKHQDIDKLTEYLGQLATMGNYNKSIEVPRDVGIKIIEYRQQCEKKAHHLTEFDSILRVETVNRFFKVMKLAGAYSFIDGLDEITEQNLYAAIKLVEDSGKSLEQIQRPEKNYEKLARYIASVNRPVNHVDLDQALKFYKGSKQIKQDMIDNAIAWGYDKHIIIKRSYKNSIEFMEGETLDKTDLNKLILSYSTAHHTKGYKNQYITWEKLGKIKGGVHWINHHLEANYRNDESIQPGFNMVVLNIDDGNTPLPVAKKLLGGFTAFYHTTKRHADDYHRFYIVLPMKYHLKLSANDYIQFMENIYEWLPFKIDNGNTKTRVAKWTTHDGTKFYNNAELFDPLPFIPDTRKNEERKKVMADHASLDNLERWFVVHTKPNENRNNQMIRYGLMYADLGYDFNSVREKVLELNRKLSDKLTEEEIDTKTMQTVAKRVAKREAA